jgi:hypothetical protein
LAAKQANTSSKWRAGYSGHHLRPSSRGGNHTSTNVIEMHDETFHKPYHRLFFNMWPHEAATLIFFAWQTQNPKVGPARYAHESLALYEGAWDVLFKDHSTPEEVCNCLAVEFAKSQETRRHMKHAQKIFDFAQAHKIAGIQGNLRVVPNGWREDERYSRLFQLLYPHEAMLIVFLAWDTFCPHRERVLPHTLLDTGGNPIKSTFAKRIEAWDSLFGEQAEPWQVLEIIAKRFGGSRKSPQRDLIKEAQRICRAVEKSGLLKH